MTSRLHFILLHALRCWSQSQLPEKTNLRSHLKLKRHFLAFFLKCPGVPLFSHLNFYLLDLQIQKFKVPAPAFDIWCFRFRTFQSLSVISLHVQKMSHSIPFCFTSVVVRHRCQTSIRINSIFFHFWLENDVKRNLKGRYYFLFLCSNWDGSAFLNFIAMFYSWVIDL